jgi:hypothetical protein
LVRGAGIALAIAGLQVVALSAQSVSTTTSLNTETRDQNGRTQVTAAVAVAGVDGIPASGSVAIVDHGKQLSSAALNADGKATIKLGLSAGSHALRAVYAGDTASKASVSPSVGVTANATASPTFTVAVSAVSPSTLTAGQTGSATVTVTPENNSSLTAPMFVTLSCSGLPDQASCSFSPTSTIEILSTSAALTSNMIVQTQAASYNLTPPATHRTASPIAWALLLPGVFGFAGLAWAGRRRRWLSRISLIVLVATVTMLGTTACNPRYKYFHHGPVQNPATPSGTYTITVAAQSSNGISAITETATTTVTVN